MSDCNELTGRYLNFSLQGRNMSFFVLQFIPMNETTFDFPAVLKNIDDPDLVPENSEIINSIIAFQ